MPIVVVLPVPLTPTIIITAGSPLRSIRRPPGRGDLGEQLDQALADRLAVGRDRPRLDLVLEPPDDLRGGLRADVGEDQRLLQALPGLVVELSNRLADISAASAWRLFASVRYQGCR